MIVITIVMISSFLITLLEFFISYVIFLKNLLKKFIRKNYFLLFFKNFN